MQKMSFSIEGMSCQGCVNAVTSVLKKLDGVAVEQVNVGSATVAIDPAKTSTAAVAQALSAAGYPAQEGAGLGQVAAKRGCCCR